MEALIVYLFLGLVTAWGIRSIQKDDRLPLWRRRVLIICSLLGWGLTSLVWIFFGRGGQ